MNTRRSSLLPLAVLLLASVAVVDAVPEVKRPSLRFTTKTRQPTLVGVPELTLPGQSPPLEPRYYRRLAFSGERQYGRGPVLGIPNECWGILGSESVQPEKGRSQLRGQIVFRYDAATDGGVRIHNATIHSGVLREYPWDPYSCSPPPSPLPVGVAVSDEGTLIPYEWYNPPNNPLRLDVRSATLAGDDGVATYAGYIGDGFRYYPTHWLNAYLMRLEEEDTPEEAEQRARVVTVDTERDPLRQTSLWGTPAQGLRWTLREVEVEERVDVCPGDYLVVRTLQSRPIGTTTWFDLPEEREWVTLKAGAQVNTHVLKKQRGYEIRLVDVSYEFLPAGCATACSTGPGGLGPAPSPGSISWNLLLGPGLNGRSAGVLRIHAPRLTPALYSPAAIQPVLTAGTVLHRTAAGVPRQVVAPHEVADIVVTGPEAYEIRFYLRAAAGPVGSEGLHHPTADPYLVWRVENPAAGSSGRWRVSRIMKGETLVTEVEELQPGRRIFSEGNGLRITETLETISGTDREEIITVRDAAGQIASRKKVVFRKFAWGEEKIREILDPDGAALLSEWTYHTNTNGRLFGRVASFRQPDGFVQTMAYDDATGELQSHVVALWKDSTTQTLWDRRLLDVDGDGAMELVTAEYRGTDPFTRFGTNITVESRLTGRRDRYRATTPNATWNTPGNIATRERYLTSGAHAGELIYRLNPDTTLLLRRFGVAGDGGRIVTEEQGASDAAREQVVDGTRTVETYSPRGELVATEVTDVATGRIRESRGAVEFDAFGRVVRLGHADGAIELRTYCDSCGGLESVTLRGEKRQYLYDALGRRTEEIRSAGETILSHVRFGYDAEGRLIRQARVDPADASETVLSSTSYDLAGRVVSEFTLGQGTTTYAYVLASGRTTVTTATFPNGGTRIETRAASGALLSTRGSAVPHIDYHWTAREWWGGGIGYTANVRRRNDDGSTVNEDYSINFLGNVEHVTFGDGARSYRYYDAIGRLVREVDPDGVTLLYGYDARGRRAVTAVDMNRNGVIDYAGQDRITRTTEAVAEREGFTVARTTTEVWATAGQDMPTEVARVETSTDGLRTWSMRDGLTTASVVSFEPGGRRASTSVAPDGTVSLQRYVGDRLLLAESRHPAIGLLSATNYAYDTVGRLRSITDTRNGTTTFTYDSADRVETVTSPDPDPARAGPGYDPQVVRYESDSMGRVIAMTHPDGSVTNTSYHATGAVQRIWGAHTYPVEYSYDLHGRLKTMTTWQDFAGDAGRAVTTWRYDNTRGFLIGKNHADNRGPTFGYTAAGRVRVRAWSRGVSTTYGYNNAGELAALDHSDSTTDVALTYDRLGRVAVQSDAAGTSSLAYQGATPLLTTETQAPGGVTLTRNFDAFQRLAELSLPGTPTITHTYDAASRLLAVSAGASGATYRYLANSPLVESVTHAHQGATRLTSTRGYDALNRLSFAGAVAAGGGAAGVRQRYTYDAANQRARITGEDDAYWEFHYDGRGQVMGGRRFEADGTPTGGHAYEWTYDDIGNRRSASRLAPAPGGSSREEYTTNPLNHYTQRTVPGVVEVIGAAAAEARVAVLSGGNVFGVLRQGEHWSAQLPVQNTQGPEHRAFTVAGLRAAAGSSGDEVLALSARSAFVPKSPESFGYDVDGNLLSDARWNYAWDAENRLVRVETAFLPGARGVPRQKLEFSYDAQSRRVRKVATRYALAGLIDEVEEYFSNQTLTGPPSHVVRDGRVDGFWTAEPASGMPVDNWSYRVTATLWVPASGAWTFTAVHRGDDGVRLYLDGVLVLDRWSGTGPGPAITLPLEAGRAYTFRYEFRDIGSWAQSQLRWSGPGVPDQVVPNAGATALGAAVNETRYVYDGWNLLAEMNAAGAVLRSYVWGLDLSGSSQGAGGIGGLLAINDIAAGQTQLVAHDGSGNVSGLVRADDGAWVARYEYAPFGELIRVEGPAAEGNPFRFSTKYADSETGLVYYGYRWYAPERGRWLSRDPLGEEGGVNVYGFARNSPINWGDPLGLALYAFDGTNNDGERDIVKGKETNVYILYLSYNGTKHYLPGVGTNDGFLNSLGLAFGLGGSARIEKMLSFASDTIKNGDSIVDIVGFSRGAAQAREFANRVREHFPCAIIRWMGLFDTVASEGVPNDVNVGYRFGIPEGVGSVLHLTAGGERRANAYALTSIRSGPNLPTAHPRYREVEIPNAFHSDVGGGFGRNRGLGNQALYGMWQDGLNHSVPFGPLDGRYSQFRGVPNDSRWLNDKVVEALSGKWRTRTIYYHP